MRKKKIFLLAIHLTAFCLAGSLAWSFTLVHISPQTQRDGDMQAARKIQDLLNRELNAKGCDQCRLEIKVVRGQAELFGTADSAMLPAVQNAAHKVRAIQGVKGFDATKVRYVPLVTPQVREEKASPQGVFKAPANTKLPAVQQPGKVGGEIQEYKTRQ